MIDVEQAIIDYHENNGVVYELRAITSDGEVLGKFTSQISADDLAGDTWKLDAVVRQLALNELEDDEADFSEASE